MDGFWIQLLTVMLGSGASITIAQIIINIQRDRKTQLDAAKFLALRITFLLEGYIIATADRISDHKLAIEHDGHVGQLIKSVPQPEALPEHEAYQHFPPELLNLIFDFPQRCRMAGISAMFYWEMIGDAEATDEDMKKHSILMSVEAMEISKKLRAHYKLGPRNLTFGNRDVEKFLKDELQKIEAHEKRLKEFASS